MKRKVRAEIVVPAASKTKRWPLVIAIVLLGGLVLIAPFLSVVALAALFAFLFFPIYRWVLRKTKRTGLSAGLTLVASFVIVIVPVILILILMLTQLAELAASLAASGAVPEFLHNTITGINNALAPLNGQQAVITDQGVTEFVKTAIPSIIKNLTAFIVGTIGGLPLATILTMMYIILFLELLIYGDKLLQLIRQISPFEPEVSTYFLNRVGLMANAMAKGELLISFIIATLSSILMIFLGLGQYFFIFVVVFTLFNLVPLGCGVLVFPITIISILTGNVVPGLIVLVLYIIISSMENVVRPLFIPKGAELSAGLTMLAVLGGISYYGLIGVVYGPIIMIIIVTAITMYASYRRGDTTVTAESV